MVLRHSLFWLSRRVVPPDKLRALLMSCGLRDIVEAHGNDFAKEVASCTMYQQFLPLFTPYFTSESHHLTMLGDTIIDEYLSCVILRYAVHSGLVLTMNATRQLNAVFHNHFALRLFAKELRFDELQVPLTLDHSADGEKASSEDGLSFLEPQHVGLCERDVAGTSFYVTPLRCGQSPLGWMFSHFIGAVQQVFGQHAARRVLSHMYGDIDVNLPGGATALLLRTLQHFSAVNVAEALIAAQGLQLRFVAKTRVLPENEVGPTATTGGDAFSSVSKNQKNVDEPGGMEEAVVCSGFGVKDNMRDAASLDGLAASPDVFSSLAAGPGGIDSIGTWRRRVQRELQLLREGRTEGAGLLHAPGEANTDCSVDVIDGNDGWLPPEEQRRYKRGAAFYNSVDFDAVATYFADAYGPPQPVNGQRVARLKFKNPVRDPLFYDTRSDMRNGVPFSTDGEPLSRHLDRFTRPHKRLFEVSLVVGSGEGRTAGRAIATRYTVARESACMAYLGAVLHDLHTMRERNSAAV